MKLFNEIRWKTQQKQFTEKPQTIYCQKLESLGYVLVTDIVGLASEFDAVDSESCHSVW